MSAAVQAASIPSLLCPPVSCEPAEEEKLQFAIAHLYDQVVLVQVPQTPPSPLAAVDIAVFRHEFVTLFRYSHRATVHPSDIRILERLDDAGTLHEEENGTVFLAKDLMLRLSQWTRSSRRGSMGMSMGMGKGMADAQARASRRMSMPVHRQIPRY